mmetsp:Transcript_26144/g.21552  ORF Transcript_26144/g.21552 Transcript_26144/m.21552 type:complete len:84 (+) Transcript_26144:173-424(+)
MLIRFAPLSSPGGRRTRLFFRRSSKPIPPAHAYGMQRQTINDGHYLTAGDLTNMSPPVGMNGTSPMKKSLQFAKSMSTASDVR